VLVAPSVNHDKQWSGKARPNTAAKRSTVSGNTCEPIKEQWLMYLPPIETLENLCILCVWVGVYISYDSPKKERLVL
jgi:hypothetical protein